MNKQFTPIIAVVAIAIIVFVFLGKNTIGDIRPSLLPSKTPLEDLIEPPKTFQEVPPPFPLQLDSRFAISVFAKDLGSARDLEVAPNGTLLLSIPNKGQVVALPDKNRDGKTDEVKVLLSGLDTPHGLAFYKDKLFVAEETRVVRYHFNEDTLTVSQDKILFSLPGGGRHVTRTLAFEPDGTMFVSIGSTCDVCYEEHPWIGTVIISTSEGKTPQVFAKGLRNSVFITTHPKTNELWGTEMGRDFLGDEKPADEINIIKAGKDYGWPECIEDKVEDVQFKNKRPEARQVQNPFCFDTESPAYKIPAHSAPLGLAFINSPAFPKEWQDDLLVAYHGSWNRSTPVGYKVVRINVENGQIKGEEDFLSGFLRGTEALGRPVDVVFGKDGLLYVSDDKAGLVYLVYSKDGLF